MQGQDSEIEHSIQSAGGHVIGPLPMIQALVADLPAQAILNLAKRESVRWISWMLRFTR